MADNFTDDLSLLEGGALDTDYLGQEYEDAQTRKATPPEGKYTLRMPDTFKFALSPDKKNLRVLMDPLTVVGGDFDGYDRIRFTRVSTKKFQRSNASSAGDVLRNFGIDPTTLRTVNDWTSAFQTIAGATTPVPVYCAWRGWDKIKEEEVKGMKNFPRREDGSYVGYIERDGGDDPSGKYKVFANLEPTARGFSPMK